MKVREPSKGAGKNLFTGVLAGILMVGIPCGYAGGYALAEEGPDRTASDMLPPSLVGSIRPGVSIKKIKRNMLRKFKKADVDGGGVSSSDHGLLARLSIASSRGRLIGRFLTKDLDGDGVVDREELETFHGRGARRSIRSRGVTLFLTTEQLKQIRDTLVEKDLAADGDGDGKITFSEISAWAKTRLNKYSRRNSRRLIPMSMDGDGDGTVSESEFVQVVDRFLKTYDANGDGTFSADEVEVILRKASERRKAIHKEERARQREERYRGSGSHAPSPPSTPQ